MKAGNRVRRDAKDLFNSTASLANITSLLHESVNSHPVNVAGPAWQRNLL